MIHVVTGAPCSGKTTYAHAHRRPGELLVDLDAITAAIGGDYMRFYKANRAAFHELDPGIETCKRRAREAKRPAWTQAAIEKWYENRPKGSGKAQASRNW